VAAYLAESLARDAANVASLRRGFDAARIEALAGRLYQARRIVILGGDLAAVLVDFLHYNLAVIDLPSAACTRPGEVVHGVRGLPQGANHPPAEGRRRRAAHRLPLVSRRRALILVALCYRGPVSGETQRDNRNNASLGLRRVACAQTQRSLMTMLPNSSLNV